MEIPYEIFFFFSKTNFYEFGFTGWEVEVPSLLQKAEQKKKNLSWNYWAICSKVSIQSLRECCGISAQPLWFSALYSEFYTFAHIYIIANVHKVILFKTLCYSTPPNISGNTSNMTFI